MKKNIDTIRSNINKYYEDKRKEYDSKRYKRRSRKWDRYYQSPEWKSIRAYKISKDPICECCEKQGIVQPAEHIHHLRVFGSAETEDEKWSLLLQFSNLCSVCSHHHHLFHEYMKMNNTNYATIDDVLDYEQELLDKTM